MNNISFPDLSRPSSVSPETDVESNSSETSTAREEVESTTSDDTSVSIRERSKVPLVPSFISMNGTALPPSPHRIEVVSKGAVPVRLAKAYREIDEAKMAAITAAERKAERAHALNFRRGGNRAATLDIESKKNQEIKIANRNAQEATEKAQAKLVRGAESTPEILNTSEEEEISTHTSSSDLCQAYAEQFARIKEEEMAAIAVAENRALQSNALMVRPGGGLGITVLFEEKKRGTIDKIEQMATRKKNILFLSSKKELLEYQKTEFEGIFENYSERLYSDGQIFSGHRALDSDHFDFVATQTSIRETFQLEQDLLDVVKDPQQESDNLLLEDMAFFGRTNTARLNALKPFVELSIDQALTEIEKRTDALDESIQGSRLNKFVDQTSMKEMRAELREARASYFSAEAVSREGRSQVALQNVLNLQKRIKTTTAALARLYSGDEIVKPIDREDLSKATSLLTDHLQHLGKIEESYRQIVRDCGWSKTALPVISDHENVLTQESRAIPARGKIFQRLDQLSSLQPERSQETKLNILLELENIPAEQEENLILGSRGEIKFVPPSTIETATLRSKQDGLNLVRLAIFRDYGETGLRNFDRHFNIQLVSEHPINVGELMNFIDEESKVNPKAFYLSSIHSLRELVVGESHSDDENKLIQAGSSTFKLTSTKDDRGTDSTATQKKQAALKATREAIVEFFKELPSEKRRDILDNFNKEFKGSGEKTKPLTVQNLRSFLEGELEKEKQLFHGSDFAEALFYSATLQSVVTVWGTMSPAASTILGGWPAFFVTFGLAMVHDLTTTWRELHPEE